MKYIKKCTCGKQISCEYDNLQVLFWNYLTFLSQKLIRTTHQNAYPFGKVKKVTIGCPLAVQ